MIWMQIAETAPSPGPSPLLYIFGALAAGGLLDLLWRMYQRSKYGAREDALQIAKEARDQVHSSGELFTRYKVELEDAQRQLNEYLSQLVGVNKELGKAMARITRLEQDLTVAQSDNRQLKLELTEALAKRDALTQQIEELLERIRSLEAKLHARRSSDAP
jgi:chromosome segregation ATPase